MDWPVLAYLSSKFETLQHNCLAHMSFKTKLSEAILQPGATTRAWQPYTAHHDGSG